MEKVSKNVRFYINLPQKSEVEHRIAILAHRNSKVARRISILAHRNSNLEHRSPNLAHRHRLGVEPGSISEKSGT